MFGNSEFHLTPQNVRAEQTVQGVQYLARTFYLADSSLDLQDTLESLLGITNAFRALWNGLSSSRLILASIAQLCFFLACVLDSPRYDADFDFYKHGNCPFACLCQA